jgi:hypothetical protein
MVDVRKHSPAIGDKRSRDVAAHALAGTGNDCGPLAFHRAALLP